MAPYRRNIIFLLLLLPLPLSHRSSAAASNIATEFIYPNFTASSIHYIDKGGIFLTSTSSTFSAILSSDSPQSPFVFSIVHTPTSTVVWSANPAPYTAVFSFSSAGLAISLPNGSLLWSTPPLHLHATALQLLDSGNILLLDSANISLWQSFEQPTDTLLSSQRLPAGASLSTSSGDYRLFVTVQDVSLVWTISNQQYWRLSSDPRSVKDLSDPVAYMFTNESGLYLFSSAGRAVYIVRLPPTKLRFVRLESDGWLRVKGYSGNGSVLTKELDAPTGACDRPLSCNEIEVCTMQSIGATCNCPTSFPLLRTEGCSPADSYTRATLLNCAGDEKNQSESSYLSLGSGIDYFANKFSSPANIGGNISSCRSLCTGNCLCLGYFYNNSSRYCFLINSQIGSFVSTSNQGGFNSGEGYIKIIAFTQRQPDTEKNSNLVAILLSCIVGLLLVLFFAGIYFWRRRQLSGKNNLATLMENKSWSPHNGELDSAGDISNSGDAETDDEISIPGLPHRFTYAELVIATANFSTKIGSGGFGDVFRGDLPDKTIVAVKRICASIAGSIHGKTEFCTEIAVISSIHHVNLVRLRGFCAEGRQRRLLVYDYMNRGSLDHSLFRAAGPVLEWQERMDIAVGAARGLAYLHSGCDRKIIHCDVKPENILLHDIGGIKISDFGLAKLLSPEQSALFTTMRGTRGYLAPEWLSNSAISERADVYSYGMVLLEIISGRKNWLTEGWSSASSGEGEIDYFPLMALEMHEKGGRYLGLADRGMEGRVREEEVGRAVRVALCCLHEEPALRPTMTAVAAMLDGSMEVVRPRPDQLAFLRLCGKGFVCMGNSGGNLNGEAVAGSWHGTAGAVSMANVFAQNSQWGGNVKRFSSLR